ncbi:MAG: response regulator transcription factor [Gammaproteobacteria bacterium]|nr:MAG: response regulator transcription factor [Gammaproteobacteria bacterium]
METDLIVYIVDDDAAVRDSLCELLASEGLRTLAYSSASEFLDDCNPSMHGCALFDVRMPEMSGLELLQHPKVKRIAIPVIMITAYSDVPIAVKAIKSGAVDFIEKPIHSESLLESIRRCFKDHETQQIKDKQRIEYAERMARLSPREREVMELLVQGKLNRQIAVDLGISPRTVEVHRAAIKQKLGVKSLPDIVHMALSEQGDI